jgi:aldose 1-epimerase
MGYPGPIKITAQFHLMDPYTLDIVYSATSEQPTIINLVHHSYFNLSGEKTILDHELKVNASTFLEVDSGLIPKGNPQPVKKGDLDFRLFRTIQPDSGTRSQLDHNFCLSLKTEKLRPVAWLKSKELKMQINTTEPGLQVYDGHGLDVPVSGLEGRFMGRYAGIALEPQIWPDSPNRSDFPNPVLNPGEIYSQHTQYIFFRSD